MSCSYEIGVMANKNVALALDKFFESEDAKTNWSRYERKKLSDGTTMYRTWCNNHPSFYSIGKKFLEVLKSFKESELGPDAFKCIMVSEEGSKEEISNVPGQLFYEDFDSANEINYPESFEDSTDYDSIAVNDEIQNIAAKCDMDTSASKLAELLMDDENSTYKMFEELASAYDSGSAEFRKGMDSALSVVTGWNLLSIAKQIEAMENTVEV